MSQVNAKLPRKKKRKRNEQKKKKRQHKIIQINKYVRPNIRYSEVAKNNPTNNIVGRREAIETYVTKNPEPILETQTILNIAEDVKKTLIEAFQKQFDWHRDKQRLNIVSVNVNSIIQNYRRATLLKFMKTLRPDIVLISETKLNNIHKISFQNYDIIRTDRPNSIQGGGTAIAIKRNIRYTNINLQALTNSEIIETTVIKLNLTDGVSMYIIAAYAAGNHKKEFHLEFAKIFRYLKLEAPNNYYVIAGDLNAKHQHWKNNTCNPRGTFLFNWLRENDIKYKACLRSTDIPSFPRGNSYIDICIADCRLKFHNTDKDGNLRCLPYDSDHNAISMTISKENDTLFTLEENNISHSLNYRRTDWDKFRRVLNKDCRIDIPRDRNLSNHEINSYLTAMNEVIKKGIHSTVPKIKHRDSMEAYSNERIRDIQKTKSFLITNINRAYRRFEYHDNPELTMLKDTLLEVKQKLKQEYSISINKYWRKKIDDIPKNDPENMFPIINRIFRPRGKAAIANLQIPENNTDLLERAGIDIKTLCKNQSNNYIITEPKDKLNVIGAHFENIHTQNSEMVNKLTSDICWALNNNECVGACLIDLEKAFDTVWTDGLIYKMIKKKFPDHLVKLTYNMVQRKSFVTTDGNEITNTEFEVKNGLQQGTVNSLILFNIYNSDILRLFDFNSNNNKSAIAFADDLIIYYKGKKASIIQEQLEKAFHEVLFYCDS
ncbi:hypothetical protein M0802_016563 [Mischocyttarus mexicanus]|nr:hypothetical protein M0802_016563 [Mischocyttarus mexicanus]